MFDWLWRRGDDGGVDGGEPGGLALLDRFNDELERFGAPLNPSWARAGDEDDDLARLEDALRGTVDIAGTLGRLSDHVGPRRRNRRDDVAKVELMLGGQGYLDLARTNGPTGYFGAPQEQAIRRLQADRGLTVDGWAAPDGETVASLRQGLTVTGDETARGGAGADRPAPGPIGPVLPPFPHPQVLTRRQADAVLDELGGAARAVGDFIVRNQRLGPRTGLGPPPFPASTDLPSGPPPSVRGPRPDPALPGPSANPLPAPAPESYPAEELPPGIHVLLPPDLEFPIFLETRRGKERVQAVNFEAARRIEKVIQKHGLPYIHHLGTRDKDGVPLKEQYFPNAETGKSKGGSYVDITLRALDSGRKFHIQTVDTYADGSMSKRELENAWKLYKNMGKDDGAMFLGKPTQLWDIDWDEFEKAAEKYILEFHNRNGKYMSHDMPARKPKPR